MNTTIRMLRASADEFIPARPHLTPREREQRETILRAGRAMMAEFGRHTIRMTDFAAAIRLSPATIRRHFADLDNLLATILRDHLMDVVTALGAIPRTAPNRAQACRAAYLAATRTGLGAPSLTHLLLIRDRHLLPDDELSSVEAIRANIGDIIAGEHADLALSLLDTPQIHPSRMEAALAALLAAPVALEDRPPPPLSQVAPFTPRPRALRPLRLQPAPERGMEWPNPSLWERAPPASPAINGFHGTDLSEPLRRASS